MRGGHVFEPTSRWVPAIAGTAGSVLPTPQAWDANRGPDNSRLRGDGLRPSGQQGTLNLAGAISLLPTPVVNDMGAGKTVEKWDAWTAEQREKHRNGNGHGKSLSIEVRRLLPTPTAQDGANNAGPSQWNRNSDPLNVVAAKLGGETMPTPSPDGSGPVDGAPPPQ